MTPMRLAVYGFVADDGGSLASAHPLVLKHLLDAGHTIDFYAIEGHNRSQRLDGLANYRYLPITQNWILPAWRFVENVLRGKLRQSATIGLAQISNAFFERAIRRAILVAHRTAPYDALFVMGMNNPFGRVEIPTVSWTQGIASAERQGVLSQRDRILRYCGRLLWWQLLALYRYKLFIERRRARDSDVILCGSEWAKAEWMKLGAPSDSVFPICYPIDLERFTPPQQPRDESGHFDILSLGRTTPRKRLDLLLDGFALFRAQFPGARLRVVGGFSYVPQFRQLIDQLPPDSGVIYHPSVPRREVLHFLHTSDCLIQTSEYENLGSSVLEAQACGLPVIVGKTNGTADYISASSVVFQDYTPQAVADAMAEMKRRIEQDRPCVASDARASGERHAHVDAISQRIERLLDQVRTQ